MAPGLEVRVIQYFLSGDKNGIDYFPVCISVHTVGISGPYCAKRRKKLSVALVFGIVAMLGCYLPARRASRSIRTSLYDTSKWSPLAHAPPVRCFLSRCSPVHDIRQSARVLLARGSEPRPKGSRRLLREASKETIRLPLRTRGLIRHRFGQFQQQPVILTRGLEIHGLVQIVRRRV